MGLGYCHSSLIPTSHERIKHASRIKLSRPMSPPVDIVSLTASSMCRNAFPTFFLFSSRKSEQVG